MAHVCKGGRLALNLDIFKPKTPPVLGMDISSSSVKLVELVDAGKGTIRVERYAIEQLAKDSVVDGNIANLEAVVESVTRGWKKLGTRTKTIAMALPTAAVITKVIIVPAGLREEEMEVQVESEANQYIPFALEEVNLDFQVIGPAPSSPDEVQVLIAASRKEKVEDRVAVAEAAGLKALVMDVENYAVQASFELIRKQFPGDGRDQNIALVDIGASITNIVVLRNDQAVYTREQAFGGMQLTQEVMRQYGMSQEEAEAAKRSGGLPDNYESEVLRPFLENVALEIQRAMQFFFTSTQYNSVDHILLTGGTAVIPGMEEMVSTRTQVNTVVANPFAGMAISPRIQLKRLVADAPSLMVACGLALRRFDS
jgi:type IV pilus assembly protein PilM